MTRVVTLPPEADADADGAKPGGWWHQSEKDPERIVCDVCPRNCAMKPGDRGFCFVRENRDGQVVSTTYGRSTGFCIDPIEKKPLSHFYPGTPILSFGTAGCNLGCLFCQNWTSSRSRNVDAGCEVADPAIVVPQAILAGLANETTTHPERRRMVIEAEVLPFRPEEREQLNPILCRFIEEFRNSDDPEDLVAVASAIRKYVATMDPDSLGSLGVLLTADQNATVPLEVELEVAKTLVRKLVSDPREEPDSEPELGDCLMEMAGTYLNARLLSREKYGAAALNAVLALLLLRSRHVAALLRILSELPVPWFRQLVVRRAARIQSEISQRLPKDRAERCLECINLLCNELVTTEG